MSAKIRRQRGWSGGYSQYRYGDGDGRPVYNPAAKKVKPEPGYVRQVAEALREWDINRWEKEASLHHYVRRQRIREDRTWDEAEAYAAAVVHMAFVMLGRGPETRPAKDEGQVEHTISEDYCLGCFGPLDQEDIHRQRRFCCDDCARMVVARRQFSRDRKTVRAGEIDKIGLAAYIETERAKNEPRVCPCCTRSFKPRYARSDQVYCSKRCQADAQRTLEPVICKCCNKPFPPIKAGAVYCSKKCEVDGRSDVTYLVSCHWCSAPFDAHGGKAMFCSGAHKQAHHRAMKGILPVRIGPPVFDFLFAQAA